MGGGRVGGAYRQGVYMICCIANWEGDYLEGEYLEGKYW